MTAPATRRGSGAPTPPPRPRSAFAALLASEARLLRREPGVVAWAVVIPVVATIVLALVPATRSPQEGLGGWSFSQVYLPVLVLFTTSLLAVQGMPTVLAQYRADGVLKRLRTTPAAPAQLLAAVMVVLGLASLAVAAVLVAIPAVLGNPPPGNVLAFGLVTVLALAALLSIGALVSALAPDARVATGVGTLLTFVLWFFAGMWIPRTVFPEVLGRVADLTPSGAASAALLEAMHGGWPSWAQVGVLLAWTALPAIVAARTFRWG
ncbi:ABC transporter permease [Agilicoccus flavus]|uniref:ABC transporter permease n=1 Tax=Agilicoccus flavus TaxID=2775968 RepID=UPI001CF673E1|nr:ABC transporter permease [Agilicoccus flavus]